MKKRCIYCGKRIDDQAGMICPHCGKNNDVSLLDDDGIHALHQNAHNNITKGTDRFNAGMVFLVTGGILLILGLVFFFLSYKSTGQFDDYGNLTKAIKPLCTEFIVSMICLGVSFSFLAVGIEKVIRALMKRHYFNKVIESTQIERHN